MPSQLGTMLLIANPAAQNGRGADAATEAAHLLRTAVGEQALDVVLTERPGHAVALAAAADGYDTVLALGGDGIIHEVAGGLMERAVDVRPALGIVPVGSGNDYARTLGMSCKVEHACAQLLNAAPHPADLGRVNGHWFVETLSFGLDAAIALDTVERRKRTGRTGTILYAEAGIDQLLHHLDVRRYTASFDGGAPVAGASITFAVQIGPSYGGGFKICPDARFDDGLFDVCIAHPPIGVAGAALIFALAKSGRHTGFKQMEFRRVRTLRVEFDEVPPAQMDGELIEATTFDVSIEPRALNVLLPA